MRNHRLLPSCLVLLAAASLGPGSMPSAQALGDAPGPGTWQCWGDEGIQPCHHDDLAAVSLLSPDSGWAVGEHATILRWDGDTWRAVAAPVAADLNAVAAVTEHDAWAVGRLGTILHWNGDEWERLEPPTGQWLGGVASSSPADAWAVVSFGSASMAFGKSVTRMTFGEGEIPLASLANKPYVRSSLLGSVTCSVHWPAGSPSQRTVRASLGRPPAGKTAVGRGNLPMCRRYRQEPLPP